MVKVIQIIKVETTNSTYSEAIDVPYNIPKAKYNLLIIVIIVV